MAEIGTERLTMSVAAAALTLGISRNSAYALISEGRLPHLRLGRRLVVPVRALERMLDQAMDIVGAECKAHGKGRARRSTR